VSPPRSAVGTFPFRPKENSEWLLEEVALSIGPLIDVRREEAALDRFAGPRDLQTRWLDMNSEQRLATVISMDAEDGGSGADVSKAGSLSFQAPKTTGSLGVVIIHETYRLVGDWFAGLGPAGPLCTLVIENTRRRPIQGRRRRRG